MWIDVPVVGQSYQARNKRHSNQDTINFYPNFSKDGNTRTIVSLEPIPGNLLFGSVDSGKNRGAIKHDGSLYVVNGGNLYRVNEAGTGTSLGAIEGNGKAKMATDGKNLVIATGGAGYVYNTSLTKISDGDYDNGKTVSYFNDRFIFDTSVGFCATDVGDPLTISSENVSGLVSSSDDALGVFSIGQKFFPFSSSTIESWWNPGGEVNFTREDFAFEFGVAGSYAVDINSNFGYLLGSDLVPYRITGLSKQAVGNPAIGKEFESYSVTSDCRVVCATWDNEKWVFWIFPSADRSWLMHEGSETWWRISGGLGLGRHAIEDYIECYDKKLIIDYDSGNIYELSWDQYTDNGQAMYWERITPPVSSKTLKSGNKRLFFQGAKITLETGGAPISGQGATPQLMFSWSVDNGVSYIGEILLDCGVSGDNTIEVSYNSGMGFIDPHQNMQFKLRMTDPQRWAITDMQINVEAGEL